mgnify:CR=1 FL=1
MFAGLNLIVDNWLTRLDVEVDHNSRRPLGPLELDADLVVWRERVTGADRPLDALELLIEKPPVDVPLDTIERELCHTIAPDAERVFTSRFAVSNPIACIPPRSVYLALSSGEPSLHVVYRLQVRRSLLMKRRARPP